MKVTVNLLTGNLELQQFFFETPSIQNRDICIHIFFVNSRSKKTKCKHMDDCTEDAFCNGRNATCPNPDPKPDNVTECNQGTQVCCTDKSQFKKDFGLS